MNRAIIASNVRNLTTINGHMFNVVIGKLHIQFHVTKKKLMSKFIGVRAVTKRGIASLTNGLNVPVATATFIIQTVTTTTKKKKSSSCKQMLIYMT